MMVEYARSWRLKILVDSSIESVAKVTSCNGGTSVFGEEEGEEQ
jgi:hypothetical protein